MKNFFIHKDGWDDNITSLPDFIRFSQYDRNYSTGLIDVDSHKGTMGNEYWDFSIDCRQEALVNTNEDPFININEFFVEQTDNPVYKHPIFKTDWLKARYHIIEIPDYGHQSMSPYFKDFIPQVWIDGKKLWQKYVGIIRQYALKKAFLLICKENTNLGNTPYNDNNTPVTTIDVRIVFKTNIETQEDDSTTLTLTSGEGEIGNDKMFGSSLLNAYTTKINGELYENFRNFSTITHSGSKLIFRQSGNNSIKDYFRQSFIRDYEYYPEKDGSDDPGFITEASDAKSVLKLDSNSNLEIELLRKHLSYDAIYTTDISSYFKFFRRSEIVCYKKDGTIYTNWWDRENIETTEELEFIPDFQTYRKFVWKNVNYSGSDNLQKALLLSSRIYPVRNDNEILMFTLDGKLTNSIVSNMTVIIYDNGVSEHDKDFENTAYNINSEEFNYISRNLSELETPFDPYLADITLNNEENEKDIFALDADQLGNNLIMASETGTELFYHLDELNNKIDLLDNNKYFKYINDNLVSETIPDINSNIEISDNDNEYIKKLERNMAAYILESPKLKVSIETDSLRLNEINSDVLLVDVTDNTDLEDGDTVMFNIISDFNNEFLYSDVFNVHNIKTKKVIPVYTETSSKLVFTKNTPTRDELDAGKVYTTGTSEWETLEHIGIPAIPELTEIKTVYFKPPKEWVEDDGKYGGEWHPIGNTITPVVKNYSLRNTRTTRPLPTLGINKVYFKAPLETLYLYAILENDNGSITQQMHFTGVISNEENIKEASLFETEYDFDFYNKITFTTDVGPHIDLGSSANIYYLPGRIEEVG